MNRHKCILVAEDDENDFFILRRCLEKAGLIHKIVRVRNGQAALDYLDGKPPFSDRDEHPFPDLLLTDLKMPCMDGFDLLRRLQFSRELSALPVVVLSASFLGTDVQRAKSLGAREYLIKPADVNEYREMLLGLHQRWLRAGAPSSFNKQ